MFLGGRVPPVGVDKLKFVDTDGLNPLAFDTKTARYTELSSCKQIYLETTYSVWIKATC